MNLPEDLSPEKLKRNPSLLAHWRPNLNEITAFDGLVGAVVNNGRHIVTSPNSKEVFSPPLGGDRRAFLRSDLRFGDDDPVQWPQPFLQEAPHLGCIPKQPQQETPLSIMWWTPTLQDFEVEYHGVIRGIGKINSTKFWKLKTPSLELITRAKQPKFTDASPLPNSLITTLQDVLYRLQHVSTSFRTTQLGVRAAQRAFLELLACTDFLEIYKPLIEGQPSTSPSATTERIGVFTPDANVASMLYRAKIPVWFIRPYTALHTIRIDKVVRAQPALGLVELEAATRPSYPPTDAGSVATMKMYHAIVNQILAYLRYPDPFGSVRAGTNVSAPLPTPGPSKKETRLKRFTPYANRKKDPSTSSGGRNKFEDPLSPLLPPAIPSWRRALENVNVNAAQFAYPEVIPTDLGYCFPEPALILSVQSPERQKGCFKTWLKFRSTLIYRMSSGASDAQPMPNSVWRKLLSGDFLAKGKETGAATRSQKLKEMAADFLQGCLDAEGVELTDIDNSDVPITWNGKTFESLEKNEYEEIIWELAELNFRFELMALDTRVSGQSPHSRQGLISACLPRSATGASLLIADLSGANQGLASHGWEGRGVYVLALQELMKAWRGDLPAIIHVKKAFWNQEETEELEQAVTEHYCKTFYNYFRRPPIMPRRLSHTVAPYHPPIPKITIQDPRPNILYDINALSKI